MHHVHVAIQFRELGVCYFLVVRLMLRIILLYFIRIYTTICSQIGEMLFEYRENRMDQGTANDFG